MPGTIKTKAADCLEDNSFRGSSGKILNDRFQLCFGKNAQKAVGIGLLEKRSLAASQSGDDWPEMRCMLRLRNSEGFRFCSRRNWRLKLDRFAKPQA